MLARALLLAAVVAAPAAQAQRHTGPPPPPASTADQIPPSKREAIRELIEITGAAALGVQVGTQMLDTMRPTFGNAYPQIPADVIDEMFSEFETEFAQVDMMELIGPVYDRHFSEDDVRQLVAFYESPLGQRTIAAMPAVMQESMIAGQRWGEEIGERVTRRILARLRKRGYDV